MFLSHLSFLPEENRDGQVELFSYFSEEAEIGLGGLDSKRSNGATDVDVWDWVLYAEVRAEV